MAKSSRSRARERKKEREKQQQRNRQLLIVGGIITVVVVLALLVVVSNLPSDAPIDDDVVDRYENYITGTTPEGYYRLGNPEAPVTVVEYSSFSCPGCENFHRTSFDDLLAPIQNGQMSFVYVPLQTGSVQNAEGAARTAICAGEQGKFWEMHDVLFEWQREFVNNAFVGSRLSGGIEALGLDVAAYNDCFDSQETTLVLQTALQEGVGSTPTVQVNGTTVTATAAAILEAVNAIAPANGTYASGLLSADAGDDATTEEEPEVVEDATEEVEDMTTEEPMEDMETEEAEDMATEEAMDESTEEPAAEATEDGS